MNPGFDDGLLQEFREEAGEHLAAFEGEILEIEKQGGSAEAWNRMFRAAHTIKGASGFLGLARIGAVSHSMETVLALVRDGKMGFSKIVSTALLAGVDALRRLLESAPDESGTGIEEVVARLEALLDPPTAASVLEEKGESHRLGVPGFSLSTCTHKLRQIPSGHRHQYILAFRREDLLRFQREGRSPVALLRRLQKMGQVVDDHMPGEDPLDPGASPGASILILFSTELEANHLPAATGLPSAQILELDLAELLNEIRTCEPGSLLRSRGSSGGPHHELPPPPRPPAGLERRRAKSVGPPEPLPVLVRDPASSHLEVGSRESTSSHGEAAQRRAAAKPGPAAPPREGAADLPPASAPAPAASRPVADPPQNHDLHAAAESIRVRVDVLDRLMRLAGELVLVRNRQLGRMEGASLADREIAQRLDLVTAGIQDAVLRARMQPLSNVLSRFQRIVRDLGQKLDKEIVFATEGAETELDRTLLEALSDPLTHIVRNCCDHGIELPADRVRAGKPAHGTIRVRASQEGSRVRIRIKDDGKGIDVARVRCKARENGLRCEEELRRMTDREALDLVFLPGLSTAATLSDISGRGVGMDVVRASIERLGGTVALESEPGAGTELDIHLPLTVAIVPALVVVADGARFAIPQANVEELVRLYDDDVRKIEGAGREDLFRLRDHLLPIVPLGRILSSRSPLDAEARGAFSRSDRDRREERLEALHRGEVAGVSEVFAVLSTGTGRFGILLDGILGTEEIVVEPIHGALAGLPIYSGATVLGDGEIALILDAQGLCRHAGFQPAPADDPPPETGDTARSARLLLFRSGPDEQLGIPLSAIRRVVRVDPESLETSGEREYLRLEGRSVRVERLDGLAPLSPAPRPGSGFLLLPSGPDRSWGLLATALVDSGEFELRPEPSPEDGPLVKGVALVKGRRTVLLDESTLLPALSGVP